MIVEKNDVDISKLFVWGKKFDIVDKDEEPVSSVYIRLLGDADVNRARVFALRKSAELRKKLKDPTSDERLIYVREIDELSIDELKQYVLAFSLRDMTNTGMKEVNVPTPKMPKSNASLEKMEKYQQELDAYPQKYQEALTAYIKKQSDLLLKSLDTDSKEVLHKKYLDGLIEEFCEQEAFRSYNDMELFLGCYKDENYTERAFASFDELDNQPADLKQQLRAAYQSIRIDMNELKKLREATP